jgi:hypothetical protein
MDEEEKPNDSNILIQLAISIYGEDVCDTVICPISRATCQTQKKLGPPP